MREIIIGQSKIRVRATPLALLYYAQEFNGDLIGDVLKMQGMEQDLSAFNSLVCLKITWAMAKADKGLGVEFPDFTHWVAALESFDFSDPNTFMAVLEEAMDGFFRRGIKQAPLQGHKRPATKAQGSRNTGNRKKGGAQLHGVE